MDESGSNGAANSMSDPSGFAMRATPAERQNRLSGALPYFGPAVVVSVAYMDPGNFATNIQAGARYGYSLLWVVLLANVIAMLFQSLSAKLGIVTGRNLAELCRDNFPKPLVYLMWVVSEIAAMATDLAELLGGAIGLSLLFNLPLLVGMAITALVTYAILLFERSGYRPLEVVIGALVGIIGLSYLAELLIVPIEWTGVALHLFKLELPDAEAVTIAVGIIGATVMPHALFLHSGLTQGRVSTKTESERGEMLEYSNYEVVVALTIAGVINMAMVIMATGAFHAGYPAVGNIETAYYTLVPLLGIAAAGIFLLSLIASGISSSVVGTMAGQIIMQGFVGFQMPVWVRRAITLVPSFIVVGMGVNATEALVMSQIVLSFALPFPMIALVWFTSRSDIMGRYRNRALIVGVASLSAAGVLLMNAILLLQAFHISVPGL